MTDAFDMDFPAEGIPNVLDRAGVGGYTDYDAAIGNQVSSGVTFLGREKSGRQAKILGLGANGRKRNWNGLGDELPIATGDDIYWTQGRPVEKVYKGTNAHVSVTTAKLPPKDPTVEIKHQCLQTFTIAVDNLMEKAQEKVQIALGAFEYISSNVGMEADVVAGELDLTDCKVLDEETSTIKFRKLKLYDEDLRIMKRPEPGTTLLAPFADVQYIGLTLSIRPYRVASYMKGIKKKDLGPKKSVKVYLELPKTTEETLQADITLERLSIDSTDNITELINICAGRDPYDSGDGTAPLLMTKSDGKSYGAPSAENFRRFAQTTFAEVKYEALKQVFEMSYIGDRGGILSISQRLHAISQDQWDPVSKTHINIDCHELHNVISTILKAVNTKSPPEDMPSLPQIAYNALTQDLKTRTYQYLPASNTNVNSSFPKNVGALHEFMQHAKDEEKLLGRVTATAISAVQGNSNMRSFNRPRSGMGDRNRAYGTFMAHGIDQEGTQMRESQGIGTDDMLSPAEARAMGLAVPLTYATLGSAPGEEAVIMPTSIYLAATAGDAEALEQVGIFHAFARREDRAREEIASDPEFVTFLSAAEDALREASGTVRPLECFGCGKRGHTFRHCPLKDDPRTIDIFKREWTKFAEKRKQFRASRNGAPAGKYGPPTNPNIVALSRKLQDPTISQTESESTLKQLTETVRQARPQSSNLVARRNHSVSKTFLNFMDAAEQERMREYCPPNPGNVAYFAKDTSHPVEFSINNQLPFLMMPIGKLYDDMIDLKGLFDTGGCCNLGWLPYHMKIHHQYPELFESLTKLEDVRQENIKIGGIASHIMITHIIVYYLPYQKSDGSHYTMEIGLSEDLPLNTLYGLPFIIYYDLAPSWNQQLINSKVLADEFKMKLERPQRTPIEDLLYQNQQMTKSFMSNQGKITKVRFAGSPESIL